MTECLPKIDELNDEIEKIKLIIMKRDPNDHESKMFDIKYEYGFREQNKIKRLKKG